MNMNPNKTNIFPSLSGVLNDLGLVKDQQGDHQASLEYYLEVLQDGKRPYNYSTNTHDHDDDHCCSFDDQKEIYFEFIIQYWKDMCTIYHRTIQSQ